MKVLYCILDNRFGGPHRRAHAVATRLRRHDVETVFLTGSKTGDAWRPDDFRVFQLEHLQCFRRRRALWNLVRFICRLPGNVRGIRRIIRSEDIDIVHIDGVTNFVPALAARRAGKPIVWHYNDHLPGPLRWILMPLVSVLASAVIVQGERLRDERTRAGTRLRDKTVVIHSGIDAAAFDPSRCDPGAGARLRQELGLPPDGLLIGAIGNLNRFKGHAYFIQAAAKIKRHVGNARFVIVGRRLDTDLACWERLQRLTAESGLEQDIVFTGFREDIPAVLSAMDVFVLPSVLESCPVVLLEAMAMGLPVVTTDVGAASELVLHGRTGFVVPPRDPDAIAEATLAWLAKPAEQVREMVDAARKRVHEEFAIDTIASRQLQVYESCRKSRPVA